MASNDDKAPVDAPQGRVSFDQNAAAPRKMSATIADAAFGRRRSSVMSNGRRRSSIAGHTAAEEKDEQYGRISAHDLNEGELLGVQVKTQRGLKSRHAQMIAIGGTIGTGLFVGSGQALARAGPGWLFLAYAVISVFVYGIVTATTEISTYLPLEGSSMAYFAARYVSNSLGFALGWLYWYSFAIITPYEITAASLVIGYWPNTVPIAVWITIMLIVIIAVNICPVKVYGETEFWFASIKIITLIGLLILAIILFFGGGPNHDRLGFRYWEHGLATKALYAPGAGGRFSAFLWAMIYSSFAFTFAPELLVITGGEMVSPRKNLPTAARRYFIRLIIFYVFGSLAVGVICNNLDRRLTHGGVGAGSSPWVIAIKNAGIPALDSIINAVIITSAWSSGNSYLYMSSRALYSLAMSGNAPAIFTKCNRWGVPWPATTLSAAIALLAYLNVSNNASTVFNWFINLTTIAGFISWSCCILIFYRFRLACKTQGITPPYRSKFQPWLGWASGGFFFLLIWFNGFNVFFPGNFNAPDFLTYYIGLPIFLVIYTCHRIYTWKEEGWMIPPADVDLHTGLDIIEAMETVEEPVHEKGVNEKWYVRYVKKIYS